MSDDPEVAAIETMIARLSPLTAAARGRVLRWACDRFGPTAEPLGLPFKEPPAPALPRQMQRIVDYPPGFGER